MVGQVNYLDQVQNAIFGLVIVFFLVVEPQGLVGAWRRVKTYFRAWPFSY